MEMISIVHGAPDKLQIDTVVLDAQDQVVV